VISQHQKLLQFPQAETSLFQNPNLSAIAERNPKEIASLKNSLIAFCITYLF